MYAASKRLVPVNKRLPLGRVTNNTLQADGWAGTHTARPRALESGDDSFGRRESHVNGSYPTTRVVSLDGHPPLTQTVVS